MFNCFLSLFASVQVSDAHVNVLSVTLRVSETKIGYREFQSFGCGLITSRSFSEMLTSDWFVRQENLLLPHDLIGGSATCYKNCNNKTTLLTPQYNNSCCKWCPLTATRISHSHNKFLM